MEFVEEYKGVRLFSWIQTHTSTGSQFLGHGHNVSPNPEYKPPVPLDHPIHHICSFELSATRTKSLSKKTTILKYKEEIDTLLFTARWKEARGYSSDLFKVSEKYLLEHNRKV